MNMEEKVLKANDIPMGYAMCFNDGCADKGKCMHYQAMFDRYTTDWGFE